VDVGMKHTHKREVGFVVVSCPLGIGGGLQKKNWKSKKKKEFSFYCGAFTRRFEGGRWTMKRRITWI